MTGRGRLVLALGVVVYVVAWIFGSVALYPVAVGLVLAVALACTWVGATNRPLRVRRVLPEHDVLEGEDVRIEVVVEPSSPLPPPSVTCTERFGPRGEHELELHRRGRVLAGVHELRRAARGRYVFGAARLVLEDPFGLYRVEQEQGDPAALLVYPRLAELHRVFAEGGAQQQDGRRLLLRRPSGFDLHSVRGYERGESLRKVHWPTTARRGQLMVKELEDAPRDEVAVVLDADASAVVGDSFDVEVRAAGSLLRAYVRRGRRCMLAVNSALRETLPVQSDAGEWRRALELLAAVEPSGRVPVAAFVAGEANAASRALELLVVTARPTPELADLLVQRVLSHTGAALVHVDAGSFAGRPSAPQPALLRLQRAGVPVAVLRAGDELVEVLAGPEPAREVAHG